MVGLMIILFGAVIYAGSPRTQLSSPDTEFENGVASKPLAECKAEGFDGDLRDEPAKAATFSINGKYHCTRDIYQYGERDAFFDYVIRTANRRLRQAVLALNNKPEWREQVWRVQVISDDGAVKSYLKTLAINELVESLGSGHVARLADADLPTMFVRVRRVEDTSLLIGVTAQYNGKTWQL